MTIPREEKLNAHLQKVLAEFLREELGVSPLVSVTRVEVARGLKSARAFITVFPEKDASAALAALEKKHGALMRYLAAHTRLKYLPSVSFEIDLGEKNRQRIEELLKQNLESRI